MTKQGMNPYLPLSEYVPDGEPRVFNDRLYIYGSHDVAGSNQFCMGDYVVYSVSIDNLKEWRFDGVSYSYEQSGASVEEAGNLAAPDCIQGPDGRYYLYYNRGARMGCEAAVADKPEGPFSYYGNVHFKDGSEPKNKLFDPGILIDDDGRIYLYTGFCPTPESPWAKMACKYSWGFELEEDMLTIKDGPYDILPGCMAEDPSYQGHAFYEASSPRKINSRYYMVYSSEQSHDLCYAVSDHPLKNYRYAGILVSNADLGYKGNTKPKAPYGNTHGGLVNVKGQWYIFYHRQTHGIECCRQGCAEPITLDENGVFHQAEITSCGLNGGPLEGKGTYAAAYACNLRHETIGKQRLTVRTCVRDVQPHIFEALNSNGEKEQYIANMQDSTLVGFKYFEFSGADHISIRLRSREDGVMEVFLNEDCSWKAAEIPFTACTEWTDFSAEFHAPCGTAPLFFLLSTGGKTDWLSFTLE